MSDSTDCDYDNAIAVDCPACGAKAERECRYVEGAPHNGWAHRTRYEQALATKGASQ